MDLPLAPYLAQVLIFFYCDASKVLRSLLNMLRTREAIATKASDAYKLVSPV